MAKKPLEHALEKLEISRKRKPVGKAAKAAPAPQMALDLWPEAVRGVPNAILRGALFTVMKERPAMNRELIAATAGIEIRYTGFRLNQTDLDVWEQLMHLQRLQPAGLPIRFSARSFLKSLGRSTGKAQHEELKQAFSRLSANNAEITHKAEKKTFSGSLVEKYFRDEVTQEYIMFLESHIFSYYQFGYTQVDWPQRQALGSNNLSKWLHGFYSSHAAPYPYKVETIKELCGSTTKALREFRRSLKGALEELVRVKAITGWRIDDSDLVHIDRTPTLSQQKHLRQRLK
jgi:hypothetical protein